jgi:putative glutamine amidotransferase
MLALGTAYLDAVAAAGGIPLILSPVPGRRIDELVERLDGICLSGGPDLHPSFYGQEEHPQLGPTEPDVDVFELSLARAARRRRLPLLAICRGMQVLNVARGGTLIQHLPDRVGEDIVHRQATSAREPSHPVTLEAGSRVAALMGSGVPDVNSFHHQAIDKLGARLRAVGWAGDGTIEAVEAPTDYFTVGVQWHAECLTQRPEHAGLFEGLVAAAEDRGQVELKRAA